MLLLPRKSILPLPSLWLPRQFASPGGYPCCCGGDCRWCNSGKAPRSLQLTMSGIVDVAPPWGSCTECGELNDIFNLSYYGEYLAFAVVDQFYCLWYHTLETPFCDRNYLVVGLNGAHIGAFLCKHKPPTHSDWSKLFDATPSIPLDCTTLDLDFTNGYWVPPCDALAGAGNVQTV